VKLVERTVHEPEVDVVLARALAGLKSVALPMHRLTEELIARYGALVATEAKALSGTLAGEATPG
jgi:16S rRNA G527 N7-methylase RsmG